MSKPTVLFLFNSSRYALEPWVNDGRFNVVSVDYDATDHSSAHKGPLEGVLQLNVDLSTYSGYRRVNELLWAHNMPLPSFVMSFAPCTDLAVSGARHFKAKPDRVPFCQIRATVMAQMAVLWNVPYIVENPISILSTQWRKPDVICDPCDFAGYLIEHEYPHPEFPGIIPDRDRYRKKTCLWLGYEAVAPVKDGRDPDEERNPGWYKLEGKSARTKYIRSLTPRGLSRAIYHANCDEILYKWLDAGIKDAVESLNELKRSTLDVLI